jgi:hypothetical protein
VQGIYGLLGLLLVVVADPGTSPGALIVITHDLNLEDVTIGLEERLELILIGNVGDLSHKQLPAGIL